MGSCLKIPSRNNASWKVPHCCYYLFVIFLGVTCRLGHAGGAQPTYNQSGAVNKQSQQASSASSSSQGKDRSEDSEAVPDGPLPMRYSGTHSHRGYSTNYNHSPKASSTYTAPLYGYYPVSDRDSYFEDYYERPPGRQFSARSVSGNYPLLATVGANQVGFTDSDYAATGHGGHGGGGHGHGGGHGGGGHGNGWGWGWGSNSYHESVSKVDNSSLGLLGLLGLLSLLSNVLMLITTTAAPPAGGGRRKREVEVDPFADLQLNSESRVENICQKILPSLNVIGHIQNGKIPVNCSHQEVCTANKILVNELGIQGRTAGSMLSNAIVKMLKELETPGDHSHSLDLDKYLHQASLDGRNGKDCEIVYPTCEHLGEGRRHGLPQLVAPEQVTAIVFGKNPRLVPSSD